MKKKAAEQRAKKSPATRKEWEKLRRTGITKLRCGHWSRRTRLECARPQGHKGKHEFIYESVAET